MRVAGTPDLQELVVEHVAGVPGGTRQLAAAFLVGHMAVWRVLHEQLLCPIPFTTCAGSNAC